MAVQCCIIFGNNTFKDWCNLQLQFNNSSLRCLDTVLQQVKTAEVNQELRIPDGMPDIGRVLTTWGQAIVRGKQWNGADLQLSGGVMLWVLYAPEDGTEPRCVDSWIPFQMNWNLDEAKREGPMRIMPLLTFVDSRSTSARKLMLRSGVSAMVQALSPMDAEIYVPEGVPEDIQLLKRTYPVMVPLEGGEKTFTVDEELTLPDLGATAEKLLSLTVEPDITEKKVMSDRVVFKGMLHVYALCRYEDGEIRAAEQTVPFSQLSDLDGTYGTDAQTDIRMAVTSLETDMAQSGLVRLKCGLVAQYLVDDRHVLELVQDAYSPKREVQLENTTLILPVQLDERTEYIPVEQPVSGYAGRVIDGRFLPEFPRKRVVGNHTELEMAGRFQVLTYDGEGVLQGQSSRWEGNIPLQTDESCNLLVTVKPSGKVQILSSMDDISLSTQLQMSVSCGKLERLPMVTGMDFGDIQEADPSRPSVILRNGRGEPLWEIAKQNNSTMEAIRTVNGLDGEFAPERMLLIPVL